MLLRAYISRLTALRLRLRPLKQRHHLSSAVLRQTPFQLLRAFLCRC